MFIQRTDFKPLPSGLRLGWSLWFRIAFLLASVSFLSITLGAQIIQPIRSFQLVTTTSGWSSTEDAVYWTTDLGSSWTNITPSMAPPDQLFSEPKIKDVFFLDATHGWVLLSHWAEHAAAPQLSVAFTQDGGGTWTVTPVTISNFNPEALSGDGNFSFVDPQRGWMNLGLNSSSNFNSGLLFETVDGGKSWTRLKNAPYIAGKIAFKTSDDGWIAGGPGNRELWATHDGGKTWQKPSLIPPEGLNGVIYTTDDAPTFLDGFTFLKVTYEGPDEASSAVVVFTSSDSGKTWKAQSINRWGGRLPTAVTKTSAGDVSATRVEAIEGSRVLEIKYLDNMIGWASTLHGLVATKDGGATWTNISPVKPPQFRSPATSAK
jgi:photosystem II stability/assembly factor-like uncharacterized protein